jgi:hypothetical protein
VPVTTHPTGAILAEMQDRLRQVMGGVDAQKWLLVANSELDGMSPIQALKNGQVSAVWDAVRSRTRTQ